MLKCARAKVKCSMQRFTCFVRFSSIHAELTPTGTIGASSNYDTRHNQDNAFTKVKEPKWCSGIRKWPASIWMRFDEPHRLGKISFESQYELNLILEVIGLYYSGARL